MSNNLRLHLDGNQSIRGLAAKHVVSKFIEKHRPVVLEPGPVTAIPTSQKRSLSTDPICIIGAGAAGLYAAMILDDLQLSYEIIEAGERIGGRIYTHRFNGDVGRNAPINDPARYDYIDIGAMRYPNIQFMDRVFDLFKRLDITEENKLLIEYKISAANTFEFYNGVRVNAADPTQGDVFQVSVSKGGNVPDSFVAYGVDNVANDVYKPFAEKFTNDTFENAWNFLTAHDAYSTRGYMLDKCYLATTGEKYTPQVVEWLETFETGTGLYNLAFVESTMDALDFGLDSAKSYPGGPRSSLDYSWYCIDGGSDHITSRMEEKIKQKPISRRRVTKIVNQSHWLIPVMEVTSKDENGVEINKAYSQVICTVPLGSLAAIDIPRNDISYVQRLAIRALNYDTSTKVALKFESRWWEDPKIMNNQAIKGGTSSGDIPIRTCVYPSYGFQSVKPPGALLASYTWAQDAQRLGGLAQGKGTAGDAELIELTLNNLSELHGLPVESFGKLENHYAYDWHNDPNARGAFALFGPGQFGHPGEETSLFASMKMPAAEGKLHFAGEATSVHHAWVLGALNSAWRAVYSALGNLENGTQLRTDMIARWGIPDEEDVKHLVELAVLGEKLK